MEDEGCKIYPVASSTDVVENHAGACLIEVTLEYGTLTLHVLMIQASLMMAGMCDALSSAMRGLRSMT